MTNNPPVAPIDIPEGSYWYSRKENTIRLFNVVRKWYNKDDLLTFELSELHKSGVRTLEVFAKDFVENAQNGKMIFIKNLSELSNQLKPNEPTNDTSSASSTTEN